MVTALITFLLLFPQDDGTRKMVYQEKEYRVTWKVPDRFQGRFTGRKSGYLQLNKDGTGIYRYDFFGFAEPGCPSGTVEMLWGFLLDEDGELVRFKRDYGFSYPILMKSTSESSFQGCRKEVILDFIIEDGDQLKVSSSDDWEKAF